MTYYYDTFGWLSEDEIIGRSTEIIPPQPSGNLVPNFTGVDWILIERKATPSFMIEQLSLEARNQRDQLLNDSQWLVLRHIEQVGANVETSLTSMQYAALLKYRQALRDIPEQTEFPINIDWPVFPLQTCFNGVIK